MCEMSRFWVSWYEPVDEAIKDPRPRKWPLPQTVIHYWVSGWTGDMDAATLCAVVDAASEDAAKAEVMLSGWSPREWRFVEAVAPDWMPPADRFPVRP